MIPRPPYLGVVAFVALYPVACRHSEPLQSQCARVDPVVAPSCATPAPLLGQTDCVAPGFIVVFHAQVDAQVEAPRLASAYGFQLTHLWTAALEGFSAEMSPQALAAVRCEASVTSVEYNQYAYPAVGGAPPTPRAAPSN